MRRLSLIFAALMVVGCGTKGALTLPPKAQPAAAAKSQPQPAAVTPQSSTSPDTASQTSPADNSSKPAGATQ